MSPLYTFDDGRLELRLEVVPAMWCSSPNAVALLRVVHVLMYRRSRAYKQWCQFHGARDCRSCSLRDFNNIYSRVMVASISTRQPSCFRLPSYRGAAHALIAVYACAAYYKPTDLESFAMCDCSDAHNVAFPTLGRMNSNRTY